MRREDLIDRLRDREPWDIVIVGGGATGLGTAVDAAARGYRTLLIEGHDFAKGTSSRSTKLIHGGVRYLAQGNVGLVREALHERGLLYENAPHLVRETAFVIPTYSRWSRFKYAFGLAAYDRLAGRLARGGSRTLGNAETVRFLPTVETSGLRGGVLYHDGRFDDARLAITLALTAAEQGAVLANYVEAVGFEHEHGRISAVRARDVETGEAFRFGASVVVNATGVFVDSIRAMDDARTAPLVRPSRGTHVVLDRRFLPGDAALMVPKTDDGRVLFGIPWHDRVLVGTTDTPVPSAEIEPRAAEEDVEFLLEHAARYLTGKPRREDVRSVFAGLRPLVAGAKGVATAALSRSHAVETSASGLVTVCGGKWTTYRRMAEDAVEAAVAVAELPRRPCVTASLPLSGWTEHPRPGRGAWFGSAAPEVDALVEENPAWSEPIAPGLPYRLAEVVWAARREWARTLEDVLARRTRTLMMDARAAFEAAERVADVMGAELGWSPETKSSRISEFRDLARLWF